MNAMHQERFKVTNTPAAESTTMVISDEAYIDLVRLWMLRILIMGAYKKMLLKESIQGDEAFRVIGLGEILEQEVKGEYDQRKALQSLTALHQEYERKRISPPHGQPLEVNLNWLSKSLGLSRVERDILRFVILVDDCEPLEEVLNYRGNYSLQVAQRVFSTVLEHSQGEIAQALQPDSRLATCGLITVDLDYTGPFRSKIELLRRLSDQLFTEHHDPMLMLRESVVPGVPARLRAESYQHVQLDYALILSYLKNSYGKSGVNILVYGPPGTGKTEFVRMVANELKRPHFEVATQERNGTPLAGHQRLQAYRLALNMLGGEKEAIVLFDEIEDAFVSSDEDKRSRVRSAAGKKAWINQLLESNPIPSFWLSNSISSIDAAILRRFDIVVKLDYPSRSARANIVRHYFSGIAVSESWIGHIAEASELAPAVVERVAKVISCLGDEINAETAAGRLLTSSLDAMGLTPPRKQESLEGLNYRIECINTDPPVSALAERLAMANRGRLCLYGPPGTGKTGFGHFLARQLDKRLIVKRASDLLSPWVGMAEKQMAGMFAEASDENAILLLDEADSFLQERGRAKQSWEVTQVNEMLTQMESFEGIFIASTNFMESLDAATLRRFDLKVRFDWLKPNQIRMLVEDLLCDLKLTATDSEIERMMQIQFLTPGDFLNVRRKSLLQAIECPDGLRLALESESKIKPQSRSLARIGF